MEALTDAIEWQDDTIVRASTSADLRESRLRLARERTSALQKHVKSVDGVAAGMLLTRCFERVGATVGVVDIFLINQIILNDFDTTLIRRFFAPLFTVSAKVVKVVSRSSISRSNKMLVSKKVSVLVSA